MASDTWNDTWTFNPNRFMKNSDANQNNLFIPFGLGHKQCLGMRLALLEVKFLVVNLLKKYEFCRPTTPRHTFNYFRGFLNVNSLSVALKERTH